MKYILACLPSHLQLNFTSVATVTLLYVGIILAIYPLVGLSDEREQCAQPGGSFQVHQQHLRVQSSHCKWQEALGPQMQRLALKGSVALSVCTQISHYLLFGSVPGV